MVIFGIRLLILLLAARQAQRGKRFRDNVLAFNYNLEQADFESNETVVQAVLYNQSNCYWRSGSQYSLGNSRSFPRNTLATNEKYEKSCCP